MDHSLNQVCVAWLRKIELARQHKKAEFQDQADTALAFFNGPYDWFYGHEGARKNKFFQYQGDAEEFSTPAFCMTLNVVAEVVRLFCPYLYHRNPVRQVTPRSHAFVDENLFAQMAASNPAVMQVAQQIGQLQAASQGKQAQDQARAGLMQHYLNWTPTVLDLKTHSKLGAQEAVIKGRGVLWTEPYTPPGGGRKMAGTFYESVDRLQIYPDFKSTRDALWCSRECWHPWYMAEAEYGLPENTLRWAAKLESFSQQANLHAMGMQGQETRRQGTSNDLVCYHKVYSKMGLGAFLSGAIDDNLRKKFEKFGRYCYLVVANNVPFPLNLTPELIGRFAAGDQQAEEEIRRRVQWPTPFWEGGHWPFEAIDFYPVPNQVWPQSVIGPALGEVMFLNWIFSFLAGKVQAAGRDFIAIAKSTSETLKQRIKVGRDYTFLEVDALHGSIDSMVKFMQHPNFHPDIYKVAEGVMTNLKRRIGLDELMYGASSPGMRSAAEAEIKSDHVNIRPDDMANTFEDVMSTISEKEGKVASWHLTPYDVEPVVGPVGAFWWGQLIQEADPEEVFHNLRFRVEAGSARKPNKARDVANMERAIGVLTPILQTYAQISGDMRPINALISQWCKSNDMDPGPFLMTMSLNPMAMQGMLPGMQPGMGMQMGQSLQAA